MQRIKEDVRANYAYAAFVGWQLGAGPGKNFSQYLSYFELGGKTKKMAKGEKKVLKSKALKYAAGIIARDKKRKKNV